MAYDGAIRLGDLPPEILLRIIDYLPLVGLAKLNRASHAWNTLLNTHEDRIYAPRADRSIDDRDFSYLDSKTSYTRYYDGVDTHKELIKRQTLLKRNWTTSNPATADSCLYAPEPVWRFRPDFKRRVVLSTSHFGDLSVIDMDDGRLLCLEEVRPYAHLEYSNGWLAFDRYGNAIEIWKLENSDGVWRLRKVTMLPHTCETRGFHLTWPTLCVVSSEGQGFVYNLASDPPTLTTQLSIEHGAIGHLDQNNDVVMYSLGKKGYHVHAKTSGRRLGILEPHKAKNIWHLVHPKALEDCDYKSLAHARFPEGWTASSWTVKGSDGSQHQPALLQGPHPARFDVLNQRENILESMSWGAGLLDNNMMVGISRNRLFLCTDWTRALASPSSAPDVCHIVELEHDISFFDEGGWLSFKDRRITFQVGGQSIYIVVLADGAEPLRGARVHAIKYRMGSPMSFLGVYDDCVMSTIVLPDSPHNSFRAHGVEDHRRQLTKAIHILSFAPDLQPYKTARDHSRELLR